MRLALVFQTLTSSDTLKQKIIQDNTDYKMLIKTSISLEQAKKKAESLPDGEGSQVNHVVQEELRRLNIGNKGPGGGPGWHS